MSLSLTWEFKISSSVRVSEGVPLQPLTNFILPINLPTFSNQFTDKSRFILHIIFVLLTSFLKSGGVFFANYEP
jgi:hypothetical protein